MQRIRTVKAADMSDMLCTCDMTCFLLLCIRYEMEVMSPLLFGYNTGICILV